MRSEFIFSGREPFNACHASTICQLPDGSLAVAWYASNAYEGTDDQVIMGCLMCGETGQWQEPEVWVDVPNRAAGNPVLFVGPDGNLWLMPPVNYGKWCDGGTRLFFKRSRDGGRTWSDLELFCEEPGILVKNKAICLKQENKWILPAYFESGGAPCFFVLMETKNFPQVVGYEQIAPEKELNLRQPTVVELSDGALLAYLRSHHGRVFETRSFDKGENWTKAQPIGLPNPNSGIDMVALESGSLVLAFNPVTTIDCDRWAFAPVRKRSGLGPGRTPLVLGLSEDEGKTWPHKIVLEDLPEDASEGTDPVEFSYPAVIQASDGSLHVTYTYRRHSIKHVVVTENEIKSGNGRHT